MIKAVLFDMDGVLVNSEKYYMEGTYKWMTRAGYEGDLSKLNAIIGTTMEETYRIESELSGLPVSECIRLNEAYFLTEDVIDYREYQFEDVYETLSELKKKGLKTAVCSMTEIKDVRRCLDELKISEFTDCVISSDEVKRGKPCPDIYLKALEELKVNADEAIVVEDSRSGIKAGKAAGCLTVARKDIQFNTDQSEADIILEDLRGLKDIIRRYNGRHN